MSEGMYKGRFVSRVKSETLDVNALSPIGIEQYISLDPFPLHLMNPFLPSVEDFVKK